MASINQYDQIQKRIQRDFQVREALMKHANNSPISDDFTLDPETKDWILESVAVSPKSIQDHLDLHAEEWQDSLEQQIEVFRDIAAAAERHAQSAEAQVKELKAHNQTFEESLATMQKQLDMQKQEIEGSKKDQASNRFYSRINTCIAVLSFIISVISVVISLFK